ncbi:hypothetical protein ACWDY4_34590 [Streptomyces olivaceoviridis]
MLALLHGVAAAPAARPGLRSALGQPSSTKVRTLQITDIDAAAQTVRFGKRPHPVPRATLICLADHVDRRAEPVSRTTANPLAHPDDQR